MIDTSPDDGSSPVHLPTDESVVESTTLPQEEQDVSPIQGKRASIEPRAFNKEENQCLPQIGELSLETGDDNRHQIPRKPIQPE